jgi:hypothetical protein
MKVELDLDADEVKEILSLMIFTTAPIAHAFRAEGHDIKRKVEDEHQFVIRWLLRLAAEHGPDWKKHAATELDRLQKEASGG